MTATTTEAATATPTIDEDHDRRRSHARRAGHRVTAWLTDHSIAILRISLGLVFLAFGALKFVPGASPAEGLVVQTVGALSWGVVSGPAALLVTAVAETFIGLTLVSGKFIRAGLVVLAGSMVGIMSPLVLFFGELFPGAPTLAGQYVLKDVVLVAAGLVIAAQHLDPSSMRGGSRA